MGPADEKRRMRMDLRTGAFITLTTKQKKALKELLGA
jgi:hypothetical protein